LYSREARFTIRRQESERISEKRKFSFNLSLIIDTLPPLIVTGIISGDGIIMARKLRVLIMLVIIVASASSLEAQLFEFLPTLPWNIDVDSSGRLEYLVAHQALRYMDDETPPFDRWKTDFDPRTPVLSGTVEVSPFADISARLGGSLSFLSLEQSMKRDRGLPDETSELRENRKWKLRPSYRAWEAAGLYHLFAGGGYRFSLTGGFRHENWIYQGELSEDDQSSLKDELTTNFPFMGLQTAMYFPWWKARFEVLGSPFVRTRVVHLLRENGRFLDHDGLGKKGGYLEFRMEGSMHLSPRVLIGVYGAYRYHELYGSSQVKTDGQGFAVSQYGFYLEESVAMFGLNASLVF